MFQISYYLTAGILHLLESLFQINKKQWQWIIGGKAISIDKKGLLTGVFRCWASPGDVSPSSFTYCWVHLLGTHLAASLLSWEGEEGAPKHMQLMGESFLELLLGSLEAQDQEEEVLCTICNSVSFSSIQNCLLQAMGKAKCFLNADSLLAESTAGTSGCVCQTASPKPRAAHPGPTHRCKPWFVTQSSMQQKCSCGPVLQQTELHEQGCLEHCPPYGAAPEICAEVFLPQTGWCCIRSRANKHSIQQKCKHRSHY